MGTRSLKAFIVLGMSLALAACSSEDGSVDDGEYDDSTGEIGSELRPVDVRAAVGISDSDIATFQTNAWDRLRVKRARIIPPWDVALRGEADPHRVAFESYVRAANAKKVEVLVVFGPCNKRPDIGPVDTAKNPKGIRCEDQVAPTVPQFRAAFDAFRRDFPRINLFAAWNEPDFRPESNFVKTPSGARLADYKCAGNDIDACGPRLAAAYYIAAEHRCTEGGRRACRVLAGEFASDPGNDEYWNAYRKGLHDLASPPAIWSIHPTHDVERFQWGKDHKDCSEKNSAGCTTRTFSNWVGNLDGKWGTAHIWLTETEAQYRPTGPRTQADKAALANPAKMRAREANQAAGMRFALDLPDVHQRITRIYLYNYQQDCTVENGVGSRSNDSGLLAPACQTKGKPDRVRPAFHVIATRR